MSKVIYSATVYQYTEEGRFVALIKTPCTSKKAAEAYRKVLEEWWGDKYKTTVLVNKPVNLATVKKLQKKPF